MMHSVRIFPQHSNGLPSNQSESSNLKVGAIGRVARPRNPSAWVTLWGLVLGLYT